jgi:peroxiredoxin
MDLKINPWSERLAVRRIFGLLAVSLVLMLPGQAFGENVPLTTKRAPAFTLKDTEGKTVKLADFSGKALIISFVVTWDQPSQKQIEILSTLRKEHREQDLAILALAVEQPGKQTTKAYVEQQHPSFPFLVADYETIKAFGGLTEVPTTFVLDKDHNIVQKHVGITHKSAFEADLKGLPFPE